MKKKIICFLSCLMLINPLFVVNVKADFVSNIQKAKENHDALVGYISSEVAVPGSEADKAVRSVLAPLGFLVGYATFSEATFRDIYNMKNYGGLTIGGQNATDQEVVDDVARVFTSNISVSNNQININATGRQILDDYITYCLNNAGYAYVYSYRLQDYTSQFANGTEYNALRQILVNNPYKTVVYKKSSGDLYIYDDPNAIGWVLQNNYTKDVQARSYYLAYPNESATDVKHYLFSGSDFTLQSSGSIQSAIFSKIKENNSNFSNQNLSVFSSNGYKMYKIYGTLADLQADQNGLSGYYVSNTYTDYSQTTGDYIIDSSNSNNVTIGDVQSYIDSYNTQNGVNPTPNEIQVYIDNNIPSSDPNGGGGSGGNGSGDNGSGDNGNIFDWLSTIGSLIGDLISGVGGFLTGILEGIVNALTTIFESITSIITNITSVIPDSLNSLMTSILGWLPEEWTAVLSAFLLVSLLVGLFKLFRG